MEPRQHKGAVVYSVALHVVVAAAIAIGLPWRIERLRVPVASTPVIEGVMIDQAAIEKERAAREEAARQVRAQQQREERQRREAAERERERVAAVERAKQQAEQQERDRVAAEKAERERREREAQAERERVAREREAAEKRAQERRRQQAESELQAQIAAEAEANAAREAGLLDQYLRMIESRIKQHWNRPLSARPGLDCVVRVVQLPTGDVVSATVASCNGDEAVRRSIERAVMDASPLPRPPNPALFERNVNVNFRPEE
jgi:colicin import membrane protein